MSYLLIEEGFATNDKIRGLSDKAYRLHVTALLYCATNLTDGSISPLDLQIAGTNARLRRPYRVVPALETAGLWERNGSGWKIHDYLEYNLSRKEVSRKRKLARDRKRRHRDKQQTTGHAGQDAGQDAGVTHTKTPVRGLSSKELKTPRDKRSSNEPALLSRQATIAKAKRIAKRWTRGGTDAFHDRLDELERETGFVLTGLERDELVDLVVEVQNQARTKATA